MDTKTNTEPPLTINNGSIPTMTAPEPEVIAPVASTHSSTPVTPQPVYSQQAVPVAPQSNNKTLWIILAAVFGIMLLCCCACSAITLLGSDTSNGRVDYTREF